MGRQNRFNAVLRAGCVITSVVVLAGGVTYAALQSQHDTLTGNTIETATAALSLSRDGNVYSSSQAGYDFSGLIPGGPAVPANGYPVYLLNIGQTPLALKMTVSSQPVNAANIDLSNVNVVVSQVGSNDPPISDTLQWLTTNGTMSLGNLAAGAKAQYKIQISMTGDAVAGGSAALSNIDFDFSGVAVSG